MTPLVDITFLLLTFFMFTAKFKTEAEAEQKFVIERPASSADTSKVPQVDLATIKIAIDSLSADTVYYYSMTNETDREKVWNTLRVKPEFMSKALIPIDYDALYNAIGYSISANPDTKFAIDADKRIRYKWVSDAMEALRKRSATQFNYVTDKKGGGL